MQNVCQLLVYGIQTIFCICLRNIFSEHVGIIFFLNERTVCIKVISSDRCAAGAFRITVDNLIEGDILLGHTTQVQIQHGAFFRTHMVETVFCAVYDIISVGRRLNIHIGQLLTGCHSHSLLNRLVTGLPIGAPGLCGNIEAGLTHTGNGNTKICNTFHDLNSQEHEHMPHLILTLYLEGQRTILMIGGLVSNEYEEGAGAIVSQLYTGPVNADAESTGAGGLKHE